MGELHLRVLGCLWPRYPTQTRHLWPLTMVPYPNKTACSQAIKIPMIYRLRSAPLSKRISGGNFGAENTTCAAQNLFEKMSQVLLRVLHKLLRLYLILLWQTLLLSTHLPCKAGITIKQDRQKNNQIYFIMQDTSNDTKLRYKLILYSLS